MASLYLKNGALAIQEGQISGSCQCCGVFSNKIGYTHYQMDPLPDGFEWQFVQTEDDLYLCSVVVTGRLNFCQSYTLNDSVGSGLAEWVAAGGKYFYQNEFPGCGSASAASLAMSKAGSSMTAKSVRVGPTFGNYTAINSGKFCVAGDTYTGNAADSNNGGVALLTAPASDNPSGVVLSGEKVGSGAVFLSGDSNLMTFGDPLNWPRFIERLATYSPDTLF